MNTLVTIFGQEAIAGINALMNEGGDSVRKYADELKNLMVVQQKQLRRWKII